MKAVRLLAGQRVAFDATNVTRLAAKVDAPADPAGVTTAMLQAAWQGLIIPAAEPDTWIGTDL